MLSKPVLSPEKQEMLRCAGALQHRQCRCLNPKQPGRAFCLHCWQQLPMNIRLPLYQRIGQGLEKAYQGACEYLQLQREELCDE